MVGDQAVVDPVSGQKTPRVTGIFSGNQIYAA
jgi:hypothetical protein